MYKATRHFVDGENGRAWPPNMGGFAYAPGDVYPREGFTPTEEHIQYLLGKGNRFGVAVIQALPDVLGQAKPAKQAKPVKNRAKPAKGGGKKNAGTTIAAQTPPEPDGQLQG